MSEKRTKEDLRELQALPLDLKILKSKNRIKEFVDYFDCIAFDKTGENVVMYTKKGKKLAVIGSLRMDSYTDSKGVSRVQTHIVCENVEFLSPRTEEKAAATDNKSDFVDLPF